MSILRYDLTTDGEVWTAVFEDDYTVIVPRGWNDEPVSLDRAIRAIRGDYSNASPCVRRCPE